MKSLKPFFSLICIPIITLAYITCAEASQGEGEAFVHRINLLMFQLAVIIIAAWAGAWVFKRCHWPSVLGEILAGTLIGPFALGSLTLPLFPDGLFPLASAQFPISIELYSLATIASIMLLFFAGLETDMQTFLRFAFQGGVVGLCGVVSSFVTGVWVAVTFLPQLLGHELLWYDPIPLFLGVMSTATSVGISARILSSRHRMNAPEGVTILSAAVIDDVLGIIILAIIISLARFGSFSIKDVEIVALKALGMWLGFTTLGFFFAPQIGQLLKKAQQPVNIALLALSLALFMSALFEQSGLAMIIGAYITGLSLSKTDLNFVIQEKLHTLYHFLVPIFFCVMGMMINLSIFKNPLIVKIGIIYTVIAIISKALGAMLPALTLNFNLRGATIVGLGMIPRGEVALIIAGIGLANGFLTDEIFGIGVMMTFITTLIMPPLFDKLIANPKSTLRHKQDASLDQTVIRFAMPSPQTAELVVDKMIKVFQGEGFFVSQLDAGQRILHIRKDDIFLAMECRPEVLVFTCAQKNDVLIHTIFLEVMAQFDHFMTHLKSLTQHKQIANEILHTRIRTKSKDSIFRYLNPNAVRINMKADNKINVIQELVSLLVSSGQLDAKKKNTVLKDLYDRENIMSTGLQEGIAIPHAKSDAIDRAMIAIGYHKKGLDFQALDEQPCHLFVLIISPNKDHKPYLELIAEISRFISTHKIRDQITHCRNDFDLYHLLMESS